MLSKIRRVLFSPGILILASFLVIIAAGYALLSLPMMGGAGFDKVDLWFTATSATCVTGLSLIPFSSFSFWGKCVILFLIQIGGLGLMTLSFSVLSLFLNFGIADRVTASKILDFEYWGRIRNFLTMIIGVTLIFEVVGAFLLYPLMIRYFPQTDALFNAIFYAVSAFCNSGIAPHPEGVMLFVHDKAVLLIIGFLVFAGSAGFFVWQDLFSWLKRVLPSPYRRPAIPLISLHTYVVFATSVVLVGSAAWLFLAFEWNAAFAQYSFLDKCVNGFFNALALRSSGFSTIDYALTSAPVKFLVIFLMLIGGNPVSTASGIKTTTFVILLATILAAVKARSSVEIHNRTIYQDQIYKALVILGLSLMWLIISFFVLLLIEGSRFDVFNLFFENVSAFSTCGLSVGIVSQLSAAGKIVIMVNMIVGRVGILTVLLALAQHRSLRNYSYPHERLLIG